MTRTSSTNQSQVNGHRAPALAGPPGRRNRTRIALGSVVLVLCVLAAMTLYQSASDRTEVLAVARAVPAGQLITAADLGSASVSVDSEVLTLPSTELDRVVGQIAAVGLLAGSLLSSNQFTTGPRIPRGMAIAGAILKAGQSPIGLQAGDRVLLVETGLATSAGDSAAPIDRGTASVFNIEELEDGSASTVVSLMVPTGAASSVANAGASGRLTVVVIGN